MTFPHSKSRTVLVYPGGTEIGLDIARALKPCKDVSFVSAGMRDTPADFFSSYHHEVEPISAKMWLQELKSAIEAEKATHIFSCS